MWITNAAQEHDKVKRGLSPDAEPCFYGWDWLLLLPLAANAGTTATATQFNALSDKIPVFFQNLTWNGVWIPKSVPFITSGVATIIFINFIINFFFSTS